MKKALLAALLMAAVALTGCASLSAGSSPSADATPLPPLTAKMFETHEEAFALYDQVTFEDTVETLTQRFGEPTIETDSNGDIYFWRQDGCGVAVVFYDNGRLRSKLVDFEDLRQFGRLSACPHPENVLSLNSDVTVNDVTMVLGGTGLEFIRLAQDSSVNPTFSVGYLWANDDGQVVQILFNRNDKIDRVSYCLD